MHDGHSRAHDVTLFHQLRNGCFDKRRECLYCLGRQRLSVGAKTHAAAAKQSQDDGTGLS